MGEKGEGSGGEAGGNWGKGGGNWECGTPPSDPSFIAIFGTFSRKSSEIIIKR